MSIIEVLLTSWVDQGGGGFGPSPGNDAYTGYLDPDGETVWVFQTLSFTSSHRAGFARISLANGSIIFQGNWANSTTSIPSVFGFYQLPSFVKQDGFYYSVDSVTSNLHKMTVTPGLVSNWGNGYLSDSVSPLNLNTAFSASIGVGEFGGLTAGKVGGVNYMCFTPSSGNYTDPDAALYVVNVDTMSLVGKFFPPTTVNGHNVNVPGSGFSRPVPFFDSFGNLQLIYHVTAGIPDVDTGLCFSKGSAASPSSMTTTFVPASSLPSGFVGSGFSSCYNPANNSIVLASYANQSVCVIDLVSLTMLASNTANNGTFWRAASSNINTAFSLAPGGIIPLTASSVANGRIDSINFVDAATLTVNQNLNVIDLINASSVPDKIPATSVIDPPFLPISLLTYLYNSVNFVAIFGWSDEVGSPVYLSAVPSLCGPTPPLGNPFL